MRAISYFIFAVGLGAVLSVPARAHAAPLYKVYDTRGVVTFTTRRPAAGKRFEVLKSKSPRFTKLYGSGGWHFRPMKSRFDRIIKDVSNNHSVDPALVKAVMHVESAFRPRARSHKGAVGLMQLMPATARRFGVKNSYQPEENVEGGVKYLKWLLRRYDGNFEKSVAAYNAGEGAVDRYNGIPPYSETKTYVKRVRKAFRSYRCKGQGGARCG